MGQYQLQLENFCLTAEEPNRSCFEALRELILEFDKDISEAWKFRMPFFVFRGKMFCYFWIDKKTGGPYIGIVEGAKIDHPRLVQGDRARMKILRVNPSEDSPVEAIEEILTLPMKFYE